MTWIDDYQRWLSEDESLQNAQLVVNHFAGTDWTPESLSAMCGNMRHESSINPNMYEFGYAWSADRGFGLVQWTPRSKYWNWAVSQGLPPRDGNSQLARIDYEVNNNIQWVANRLSISPPYPAGLSSYNGSFADFRQNADNLSISELTEAFMWNYEGPNYNAAIASLPSRIAFAERCFNELDFSGSGGGGSKPAFPTTEGLPISSPYGWRYHPITGEYTFHAGIDISGEGVEHPIYATQSGVVIENTWNDVSGWRIRIKHTGDPYYSQYLHLAVQSPIPVGATVTKGQVIGTMGSTGGSTGIHLDFAISINGTFFTEEDTIDPEVYLQMSFGGGDGPPSSRGSNIIELLLCDALNGWKF